MEHLSDDYFSSYRCQFPITPDSFIIKYAKKLSYDPVSIISDASGDIKGACKNIFGNIDCLEYWADFQTYFFKVVPIFVN